MGHARRSGGLKPTPKHDPRRPCAAWGAARLLRLVALLLAALLLVHTVAQGQALAYLARRFAGDLLEDMAPSDFYLSPPGVAALFFCAGGVCGCGGVACTTRDGRWE